MGLAERESLSAPVYLGIDLGTQSVRVMAVREDGHVAALASAPLTSNRDGTLHEQEPEQWWSSTVDCCQNVMQQLGSTTVLGFAVDATSGTVVVVDSQLRAVRSALMYDDSRANEEAEEVNLAGNSRWQEMSYRMQPSWALPKIVWLQRHGLIPKGARLLHQNDFINARLAGQVLATDSSNALKTGYDLIRNEWPTDVMDRLQIDPELLPEVVAPGTLIGAVAEGASKETGIPSGTPIYAGMTDGCAAQIASGAVTPGSWNSVIGTTLVIKGVTRDLLRDPSGVVYSHRSADGMWLPGGASSTGAGIIAKEFEHHELPRLNEEALRSVPTGVVVYPLQGQGERFPFAAPEAQGFTIGHADSREMKYRATLEGIACIERLSLDGLFANGAPTQGSLSVSGGATRSEAFNQIRADILQRALIVPAITEGAFGMAILAAASASSLREAAQRMVRIDRTIEPKQSFTAYAAQYTALIGELRQRGWLPEKLATFTLKGARQ
jgi:sugar (pentulose or hexulose) kinase